MTSRPARTPSAQSPFYVSQLRFVATTGANHVSLIDAQRNYRDLGAAEQRVKLFVRPASAGDRREPGWRVVDRTRGDIEERTSGSDDGETYPEDATMLYYWRDTYWLKRGRKKAKGDTAP